MKPFTDDERTVLEGFLKLDIDPMLSIDREKALLNRLEAAEKNASHVEGLLSVLETLDGLDWGEEGRPCNWDELADNADEDNEKWLASKGAKL